MLKAGTKKWTQHVKKNPKADFKAGFDSLFRYHNLNQEQSDMLAKAIKVLQEEAHNQEQISHR